MYRTQAALPYEPDTDCRYVFLQLNMATSLLLYKPTHDSWVDPMKVHDAVNLPAAAMPYGIQNKHC